MNTSHTQRKGAQQIEQHKFDRSRTGIILRDATRGMSQSKLRAKPLLGECPPYNAVVDWVSDPFERRLYVLHGSRPGKGNEDIPTSDFFSLDTRTMKWKNLTESLTFRNPQFPFSSDDCKREPKELPRLTLADSTLFRHNDTSFILIFGGYDVDDEETSGKLIVVNLRHLEWWYQTIEGGPVEGRINPTIVTIDQKLYIFGGYRHFERDGAPHASYSIAALADGTTWRWEARDVPYPQNVPKGSIFGKAEPIYDGGKILLLPWRTTSAANKDYIDFTEENIFCFHVLRQKFQPLDVICGDFPRKIEWYYSMSLDHLKKLNPKPSQRSPVPMVPSASSSALICGWSNWEGSDNDPTPEIWHLELTAVTEQIQKLNIGPMVHKVGSGFEGAALVGDNLMLLGSKVDSEEYEIEAALNPDAKYDTYLEISLRSQGIFG